MCNCLFLHPNRFSKLVDSEQSNIFKPAKSQKNVVYATKIPFIKTCTYGIPLLTAFFTEKCPLIRRSKNGEFFRGAAYRCHMKPTIDHASFDTDTENAPSLRGEKGHADAAEVASQA